jgi:hypothetical protein
MKKLKMFALAAVALMSLSGAANAEAMFAQDDFVGISFWVISMGMLAATAFFFMERGSVAAGWSRCGALFALTRATCDAFSANFGKKSTVFSKDQVQCGSVAKRSLHS